MKIQKRKRVSLYLPIDLYQELNQKYLVSTHRSFTRFIQDIIEQKPTTTLVRNQSIDEFLPIAAALNKELKSTGKNLDMAIKRLYYLREDGRIQSDLDAFEATQISMCLKIEETRKLYVKIYKQCTQK
jgi:hypothetical protein